MKLHGTTPTVEDTAPSPSELVWQPCIPFILMHQSVVLSAAGESKRGPWDSIELPPPANRRQELAVAVWFFTINERGKQTPAR